MLQPQIWVPFAWWAILAGSIVASMSGNPTPSCSLAQPCQPDVVFPMVVALVGIAAVAFWWAPVIAFTAGLGYATLSILFDPSTPGRYAAVVVGAASLAGLTVLRSLRARQARLAQDASATAPSALTTTMGLPHAVTVRGWAAGAVPLVGAAGLLLTAGSLFALHAQLATEGAHLERAQQARAQVVTYTDGDYRQVFEILTGPRTGARLRIEVNDELELGSTRVVLLDPADPSWVRLAGEPEGYTHWYGWAMLGAFTAVWAAAHFVARTRNARRLDPPTWHHVRITRDGQAELTLAGQSAPIALARLQPGGTLGHARRQSAPAQVRGPLADGNWVSITTQDGQQLPVLGPVRAIHRWRDLDSGTRDMSTRLESTAERTRTVAATVGQVFIAAAGCVVLWFALSQAGPAWDAAHGRGTPGTFTVTSEDCSGKGPCRHYGNYESTDGRYTFTGVEVVGNSADIGNSIPTLYEGHGETPDAVFAPGWKGLTETGLYLGLGLFVFSEPVRRLLGALALRRHPPTGRHAQGRA